MQRRLMLAGLGATALVGAGWVLTRPAGEAALPFAAMAQDAEVDLSLAREMTMGDPDAPVKVVEYASFTCPHCARFHQLVFGQLKRDYIDTGKVHFTYREVYFDRFSLWAGMVARCGGDPRYFGIVEMIYDKQQDWIGGGDPGAIVENLRRIGKTAGLTDADLDACLSDADHAQALVATYQQNAERDDITATPSFLIDGKKYSNMGYEDFSAILDEKLG